MRRDMAQSLPTKAPDTSRPPQPPRGVSYFFFFNIFLNCTSKLYPTRGGSAWGRARGRPRAPPPARTRQATRLCLKPVVEGRSTYGGRGDARSGAALPPRRAGIRCPGAAGWDARRDGARARASLPAGTAPPRSPLPPCLRVKGPPQERFHPAGPTSQCTGGGEKPGG